MIMKNNRNSNKKKGAFLLRPVQVQPCFSSWQPVDGQRMVPEDDGLEF